MRHLLILLIIAFVPIITFNSCKKEEPTFCYECTTVDVIQYYDGASIVLPFEYNTECEVKESEKSSLEFTNYIQSTDIADMYVVRTCSKK